LNQNKHLSNNIKHQTSNIKHQTSNKTESNNKMTHSCGLCNKQYTRKTSYDRHVILCEILHQSKREKKCKGQELSDIPTHTQLFLIVQELALKNQILETKMIEMQKWVENKKKKLNVLLWLNTNITPSITYTEWANGLNVTQDDLQYLIEQNITDTIAGIIRKNLLPQEGKSHPLFCFVQKSNVFYIYDNISSEQEKEQEWVLLTTEIFIKLLNKIHFKMVRELCIWRDKNREAIREVDSVGLLFCKTNTKLMGVNFAPESLLVSKVRTSIYNYAKTDLKNMIEYEFEF